MNFIEKQKDKILNSMKLKITFSTTTKIQTLIQTNKEWCDEMIVILDNIWDKTYQEISDEDVMDNMTKDIEELKDFKTWLIEQEKK